MTDKNRDPAEIAEQAIARRENQEESVPGRITLSTGVVLKLHKVPNLLFTDIVAVMAKDTPRVPEIWIEERGRMEPNPNDEEYLIARSQFDAEQMTAINNVFVLRGTTVEELPEGFHGPDDEEFIAMAEDIQTTTLDRIKLDTPGTRYLGWIKYYAGPEDDDVTNIIQAVGTYNNVSEADVKRAIEFFPRNEGRNLDN